MSLDPALVGRLASQVRLLEAGGAPPGAHTHPWADVTSKPATYPPTLHGHVILDVSGLQAALDGKAASSHTHAISAVTALQAALDAKSDVGHTHPGGGGASAVYLPLLQHVAVLENTTSANATWKIPAATTYGQVGVYLNMPALGTPASAQLVGLYTNTATTGTNQLGLRLGTPAAAGTTVTPLASSVVTLANSGTFPQTFVKAITPSELGSTAQWCQWALNLATSTVGPNMMSLALILYY